MLWNAEAVRCLDLVIDTQRSDIWIGVEEEDLQRWIRIEQSR